MKKEQKYIVRFLIRFSMGSAANLLLICIFMLAKMNGFNELTIDLNRYDMFYTQVSVSFIIISLVSVLSTHSQKIYWVDISQFKLVEPKFTGFVDFAAYIISSLFVSAGCLILKSNFIMLSFMLSIALMTILTIKMIGSFFGRDSVKQELREKFRIAKENGGEPYKTIREAVIENTYKAIDSKDYQLAEENIELLMDNNEYGSFINIMSYAGEMLPDLFCRECKKYETKCNRSIRTISDKYYQLVATYIISFIKRGCMPSSVSELYKVYIKGRIYQIRDAVEFIESNNCESKNKHGDLFRRYLQIDRYGLGKVYSECFRNNSYEILEDFLRIYLENLKRVEEIISKYYDDISISERMKQIYIVDFEIKTINTELCKKIRVQEIDGRQINSILRKVIEIFVAIETLEDKEAAGKPISQFDTLSSEMLKESVHDLIDSVANARLLTGWTYYSKMHCKSSFIGNELERVKHKVIETV